MKINCLNPKSGFESFSNRDPKHPNVTSDTGKSTSLDTQTREIVLSKINKGCATD